ncbi:MAG TPA: FAD-dependent oxidoreductase [Thermoanaerobaculia bacterium]|nr:FAD-dependent oxidoreductase [Thermoanaerobaculia bacterium]
MSGRLLVVGAGPMGLYAALEGVERGFDVIVLEKDEPGAALRSWGPTRFFSPVEMNVPESARRVLDGSLPDPEALLTGPEMADRILQPLARSRPLDGRVLAGHRVVGIARAGMTRTDFPEHPLRSERRFRVLAETASGERSFDADVVLDASGVTGQPCWMGDGGLPASGERGMSPRILRHLGSLEGRLLDLAGKSVLVVGHGHSAATVILRLADFCESFPRTRVTWAVRSANRRPCAEVANDPLPERQRVASAANDLAQDPPAFLSVVRRAAVESLAQDGSRLRVAFGGGRGGDFDEVVSMTGYRPDLSFLSELALEISPATEGSARLARALAGVTDCLSVPRVRPEDLASGEAGFYLIGAKSYGRSRNFLIKSGLEQLDSIFAGIPRFPVAV